MDVGIKIMSAAVNLVKEANLKVVLTSLDCLQTLIEERKEPFAAIINMTFDVLIPRLGDTKVYSSATYYTVCSIASLIPSLACSLMFETEPKKSLPC